ncbi:MAG: hypothetical protein PHV17_04900 [Candidatus Omnitrophica bacterium]|nr:hypothetical protein [Candidatus Omnitrophota bacterium]
MVRLTYLLVFVILSLLTLPAEGSFRFSQNSPEISGFSEILYGPKFGTDTTKHSRYNALEQRLQLKTSVYPEFSDLLADWMAELAFRGDFTIDQYFSSKTGFELRELNLSFTPQNWVDLKIGRQVFTWGTGDYLFINDLFPKDYVSFYIGRHDEYLKKPSDGMKFSLYHQKVNFDLILIPFFEPNTLFSGDRLSFFDSFRGGISGRDSDRHLVEPARTLSNMEYSARFFRNFSSLETALYLFRGFDKMPRGYLNEANRDLFYPRLNVYGLSLRGPFLGGISNFEFGYYDSPQDSSGDNRLIENSKAKYLFGYAKDLGNDLSWGAQYFYEQTLDYDEYRRALLPSDFRWDQFRHLTTLRLTKLLFEQTLRLNLFAFFSPSDRDGYLRPSVSYDFSDRTNITVGANLAWGEDDYTEFGQMENNKNVFFRVRYSF